MEVDGLPPPPAEPTANGHHAAADIPAFGGDAGEPQQPPANPLLEALHERWAAVREPPGRTDFAAWTALLSAADKLDELPQLRAAYDAFLEQFPLCYGLWRKYAEVERRHAEAAAAGVPAPAPGATGAAAWADAPAAVLQRACAAVPHCVELWAAYAALMQAGDAPAAVVRSVFEAGVAAVGADFTSGLLWDKYLAFESALGSPAAVAALYARVLAVPLRELDTHHRGLKSYAAGRSAADLLSAETISAIKAQLAEKRQAEAAAEEAAAAAAAGDAAAGDAAAGDAAAGDAAGTAAESAGAQAGPDVDMADAAKPAAEQPAADGAAAAAMEANGAAAAGAAAGDAAPADAAAEQPAAEQRAAAAEPAEAAAAGAAPEQQQQQQQQPGAAAPEQPADDDAAVKAVWLEQMAALHKATQARLAALQPFEAAIKRPYWHPRHLDPAQLRAWAAYLDWQEAQGDATATQRLYERCLVPCASYPDFWQRYTLWCDAQEQEAGEAGAASACLPGTAAAVLQRALQVHCREQPLLMLFAARFHEARGRLDAARDAHQQLLALAPSLLEAVLAAANFERRAAGDAAARGVLDAALQRMLEQQAAAAASSSKGKNKGSSDADSSNGGDARGLLCIIYAHFLQQVLGDVDAARAVLHAGLEQHAGCTPLWEAALFLEEALPGPDRPQRVLALYDRALAPRLAKQQRAGAADGGGTTAAANSSTAAAADGGSGTAQAAADGLPDEALEALSARSIDFADRHCDAATLLALQRRHARLFLPAAGVLAAADAATRKREAEAANGGGGGAAANGPVSSGGPRPDMLAAAAAAANEAAAAAGYGYGPPPGYGHGYDHHGPPPPHHFGPPPPHFGPPPPHFRHDRHDHRGFMGPPHHGGPMPGPPHDHVRPHDMHHGGPHHPHDHMRFGGPPPHHHHHGGPPPYGGGGGPYGGYDGGGYGGPGGY